MRILKAASCALCTLVLFTWGVPFFVAGILINEAKDAYTAGVAFDDERGVTF